MEELKSIIDSVSKNNRNSFNEFYDLFYAQVFQYSYFFLKDKEACKEVVSNVFFSVWQSRTKLNEITNLSTWLYVITKNESNRYLSQKRKNNILSIDEIPIHLDQQTETKNPESIILEKEIDQFLTKVINELPEKCKIIFLMAREEGLKPKEIAERLSINESTVRVQMKIAIEKIMILVKASYPNILLSLALSLICFHKG